MLRADLYEKTITLESYLRDTDCRACGFHSREEFIDRLRSGQASPSGCRLSRERFLALLWAAKPEEILPPIEVLQLPNPAPVGLFPINAPGPHAPILVSGNSQLTIEVLSAVLATTSSSFWYLVVNTDGHTVDMALVYKVLTAARIEQALREQGLDQKAPDAALYLPGLATPIAEELSRTTRQPVKPGPICAAELPLFFGEEAWKPVR